MVSDYFFPNLGGVESHIYILAHKMIQRGHKVVIITHDYGDRCGIRHLPAGLKVYYIPLGTLPFSTSAATLPNLFCCLPLIRTILIRERIEILHAHQAMSSLGLESVMHAKTLRLGIRTVFTDHSLFGLGGGGWGEVAGNKIVKGCLSDIDSVICVSHTGKENLVLRALLNPDMVYVIPNAIVADSFKPDPLKPSYKGGPLTIVCVSRLAYRKGIDLLIAAIPKVCASHPEVRFLIGGSGPKMIELEQMKENHQSVISPHQVELLGPIRSDQVRDLLVRGEIFLNTSLTEAFGMTILEAACAGLFVVSTNVGGIPEILPEGLIEFAEAEVEDLVRAIERAILTIRSGTHDPFKTHELVKGMYSWANVAMRTEQVYLDTMEIEPCPLVERLRRHYGSGAVFGKVMCIVLMAQNVLMACLDWWMPRENIDRAPEFDYSAYLKVCD
ncbi:hypothetical protein CROQUDRAFT_40144 [Cronartium quercuum f. sp. fusiforme G11]|uniref:Phosphatidylinositol N-acetylglucosaminyltransferase GPI3 subunit n=1 Tax=Cronartium quercuum f. sp. fusiforme G11 TaxID=708437 RepID=A0A9P6NLG0_9BASI|nr:hypothetical protein CROQUDRAFT_40144 [Cronartium quercuum f. sp. fusiforme G11]